MYDNNLIVFRFGQHVHIHCMLCLTCKPNCPLLLSDVHKFGSISVLVLQHVFLPSLLGVVVTSMPRWTCCGQGRQVLLSLACLDGLVVVKADLVLLSLACLDGLVVVKADRCMFDACFHVLHGMCVRLAVQTQSLCMACVCAWQYGHSAWHVCAPGSTVRTQCMTCVCPPGSTDTVHGVCVRLAVQYGHSA